MLKITKTVKSASVERLIKLWAERYTPDVSSLYLAQNQQNLYDELIQADSPKGRALTATKLNECLIELKCQMAKLQTNALYSYIPNIINLAEAKQLAYFAYLVYKKLVEIYQHPLQSTVSLPTERTTIKTDSHPDFAGLLRTLEIEELAAELEPVLLEFQEQHIASKDWRTLGFITTLLNFSNKLILMSGKLTLPEQILLKPYFKFVEEQVALPWQRVCAAAARHNLDSPAFILVEQMFPLAPLIAQTVYNRLIQLLPNHRSRRGGLNDPGITHSGLRDIEMFQAYLWLCILEESMAPFEEELVDLCVMVMTAVDVKWEMIQLWNEVLSDELLARVQPSQRTLLLPYTQGLQQAFLNQIERFTTLKNSVVSSSSLY